MCYFFWRENEKKKKNGFIFIFFVEFHGLWPMMMMEANKCKKIFNWPFPFFLSSYYS